MDDVTRKTDKCVITKSKKEATNGEPLEAGENKWIDEDVEDRE